MLGFIFSAGVDLVEEKQPTKLLAAHFIQADQVELATVLCLQRGVKRAWSIVSALIGVHRTFPFRFIPTNIGYLGVESVLVIGVHRTVAFYYHW